MRSFIIFLSLTVPAAAADGPLWHSDYSSARKESAKSGKAMCVVIGSDNCFYCQKLEAGTLVDTAVAATLQKNYVAVKVDASKEPDIAKALNVQLYPTTVLAGADGRIHAIINGYVSPEQMRDHLKRTLTVIAEDERLDKDFQSAKSAYESGELAKAMVLLRATITEAKDRPIKDQAKSLLEKVEKTAAARATVQALRPQALLDVAKQLNDGLRYADALDVAAEVQRSHPSTAEAKAAGSLIEEIRSDPEKLRVASRQADEKAAALQLALSESLLKKGDTVAARQCLDQVLRLSPTGPHADAANIHLTKLKGRVEFVPATLKK